MRNKESGETLALSKFKVKFIYIGKRFDIFNTLTLSILQSEITRFDQLAVGA